MQKLLSHRSEYKPRNLKLSFVKQGDKTFMDHHADRSTHTSNTQTWSSSHQKRYNYDCCSRFMISEHFIMFSSF